MESSILRISLEQLNEWEPNPRSITKNEFLKLKDRLITMEQIKPLLVTPDPAQEEGEDPTRLVVIGGNMRLRAYKELFQEGMLEDDKILCMVIDFLKGEDGLWRAIINGKGSAKRFKSKQDGMLEYSFLDNERSGFYDMDALANILPEFDIDLDYTIDTKSGIELESAINRLAPGALNDLNELPSETLSVNSAVEEQKQPIEGVNVGAATPEVEQSPPGNQLAQDRMDEIERFEARLVKCPDCACVFDPKKHRAPDNATETEPLDTLS